MQAQAVASWIQDLINALEGILVPISNLILVIAALVIVVDCIRNAYELVTNLRRQDVVLRATGLGAEMFMAVVLLALVKSGNSPVELLYLGAAAAVAIAVRLGVAKLSK